MRASAATSAMWATGEDNVFSQNLSYRKQFQSFWVATFEMLNNDIDVFQNDIFINRGCRPFFGISDNFSNISNGSRS